MGAQAIRHIVPSRPGFLSPWTKVKKCTKIITERYFLNLQNIIKIINIYIYNAPIPVASETITKYSTRPTGIGAHILH